MFYHEYELARGAFFFTSDDYKYGPGFGITIASGACLIISGAIGLAIFCVNVKKMVRLSSGDAKVSAMHFNLTHSITQPSSCITHTITQPGSCITHAVTQPSSHKTHTITQPLSHKAHTITQPSSHKTHTITQPSSHQTPTVTQPSNLRTHTIT